MPKNDTPAAPTTPARDLLHTLATNAARNSREAMVPPTLIFDALREEPTTNRLSGVRHDGRKGEGGMSDRSEGVALAKEYRYWVEGPQTEDHLWSCAYRQDKDDDCDCGQDVQWTQFANDVADRLADVILCAKPELPSLECHFCRFDTEHHHAAARDGLK